MLTATSHSDLAQEKVQSVVHSICGKFETPSHTHMLGGTGLTGGNV